MDPDYKDIINSIGDLHKLQQQAVDANLHHLEQDVNIIVVNKIKDENKICHLLDALLDLAFDDKILVLFKKLCRHYYFINKEAAFDYVNAYREMWDADSLNTAQNNADVRDL